MAEEVARFKARLAELCSPCVVVLTTEAADNIVRKNGLQFVDLLRPYRKLMKTVSLKATREFETISIEDFEVRLVTLPDLTLPNAEKTELVIGDLMREYRSRGQMDFKELVQYMKDLRECGGGADASIDEPMSPWYGDFRQGFYESLLCSDHETFNHPVACITVASADETAAVGKLATLYSPQYAPEQFKELRMDTDLQSFAILLHDNNSSNADITRSEETFRQLQSKVGAANCRLLPINSLAESEPNMDREDMWTPLRPRLYQYTQARDVARLEITSPGNPGSKQLDLENIHVHTGQYLSEHDLERIQLLMQDFMSSFLVPYLEQKIKTLNTVIQSVRKGFKNQWKLWWKGRGSSPANAEENALRYKHTSPEMQMRRLADLAFMVRDYDGARELYRSVMSDFKGDRALKRLAGTQEMTALSSFCIERDPLRNFRDIVHALEEAAVHYSKSKSGLYAVRSLMFVADIYRARSDFNRAGDAFIRASTVDDAGSFLRSGLFLEQTALCYLRANLMRKFGFYLILAGYRFSQCGQHQHAVRCYLEGRRLYAGPSWSHVMGHIFFTLGRLNAHLNDLRESVSFYHKFLSENRAFQSADQQDSSFMEFLAVVKALCADCDDDALKNGELSCLAIPTLRTDKDVQVLYNRYSAPMVSTEKVGSEWLELENDILQRQLKRRSAISFSPSTEQVVVAGEQIVVEVVVENPLDIEITIENFRLEVDFEPTAAGEKKAQPPPTVARSLSFDVKSDAKEPSDQDDDDGVESKKAAVNRSQSLDLSADKAGEGEPSAAKSDDEGGSEVTGSDIDSDGDAGWPVLITPITVTLGPAESRPVRFVATPLEPGNLEVKAIQWTLADTVSGRKPFSLRGKRLNATRAHKLSETYEEDRRLQFTVIPYQPQLQIELQTSAPEICYGQIQRSILCIRNTGQCSAKNICINISHPTIFHLGESCEVLVTGTGDGDAENTLGEFSFTKHFFDAETNTSGMRADPLTVHFDAPDNSDDRTSIADSYLHECPFAFTKVPIQELQANATLQIPLYVYGSLRGEQLCRFLVYYEGAHDNRKMPYRLAQLSTTMTVRPSLEVLTYVQPSQRHQGEYVVELQCKNAYPSSSLEILQVSSIGAHWNFSLLDESGSHVRGSSVEPLQSYSSFYRAKVHDDVADKHHSADLDDAVALTMCSDVYHPAGLDLRSPLLWQIWWKHILARRYDMIEERPGAGIMRAKAKQHHVKHTSVVWTQYIDGGSKGGRSKRVDLHKFDTPRVRRERAVSITEEERSHHGWWGDSSRVGIALQSILEEAGQLSLAVVWRMAETGELGVNIIPKCTLLPMDIPKFMEGMKEGSIERVRRAGRKAENPGAASTPASLTRARRETIVREQRPDDEDGRAVSCLYTLQECPLKMTVQYEPVTYHDFSADGVCIVPVTITVVNASLTPVSFTFELGRDGETGRDVSPAKPGGVTVIPRPVYWSGATRKRVQKLPPLAHFEATVSAHVFSPCVVELNDFACALEYNEVESHLAAAIPGITHSTEELLVVSPFAYLATVRHQSNGDQ